jgi:hypothetical protein
LELPEDGQDICPTHIGDVYNNKYRNILQVVGGKDLYSICIPQKYANIPNYFYKFYIDAPH